MDRENVIKGLELCKIGSGDRCYETECPYYEQECTESLKNDVLELLKEQKEKPLRCDKCCYHREDGWCAMQEQWVTETDYCSFGAWKGQ